jgi:hypothetical protein
MSLEQDDNSMVDLTEELQDGILTNPNENALFNADFFKDHGPQTYTIRGFIKRQFRERDGKTSTAWVVRFYEDVPGLKLNIVNQAKLVELMGSTNFRDMISRKITLYYDKDVMMAGKKVGGIRLERAEDLAS